MRDNPVYTRYHPHWLRRRVSTYWWLQRRSYFAFILREVSSVFVAWTVVVLLTLVAAVGGGPAAYGQWLAAMGAPALVVLNLVALFFLVFHAVTWFNLAPQAMVVHAGSTRVPGVLIAGAHYAAWVVASALVLWMLLGRSS